VEPAEVIKSFAPFQRLSAAGRQALTRGLRSAVFTRGGNVLSRGDQVAGAYLVVTGRLRVYTLSAEGREATLYTIDPGETCVLALNCLFSDLRYPAWVDASAGTRVAIVDGPAYRSLFEQDAAVRDMTVRAFSTVVFRLMSALEDVHTHALDRRLATFLVVRASSSGEVRMTQQAIADHLGTTREVVARLLARFSQLRFVSRQRGAILVHNPSRLSRWAAGSGGLR
jgi:CRP/FNR family transcriptional regulator